MKLALALAALCLVLAAVYALAPVGGPAAAERSEPELAQTAAPEAEEPAAFEPVAPAADEALEEVDTEPPGNPYLGGRVNPRSGAQPEVHVLLEQQCPVDDAECEPERVELDADPATGEFGAEVDPGVWRVVARADEFLPAMEEGLSIARGEELGDIVMTLDRGESVSGSVEVEGEPAPDVEVVATGNGYSRLAFTDEWGRFVVKGLPRGTYTVRAYSSPNGGDEKSAVTGSSVALSLGHREKVWGRVVDARGFPVEGAFVYSDYTPPVDSESDPFPSAGATEINGLGMHGCGPSPECYRRAVTDAAGRFELTGAPGETLVIGARHGHLASVIGGVVPGDGRFIELVLKPGPRVQMRDARGRPGTFPVRTRPSASFFRERNNPDGEGWVDLPWGIEEITAPRGVDITGELPPGVFFSDRYAVLEPD